MSDESANALPANGLPTTDTPMPSTPTSDTFADESVPTPALNFRAVSMTFADGTPIPDAYVAHVRDNGLAAAVDVNWYAGDLLLIDNVAVAHGRRPYTGPRRVLVAMSG